MQRILALVVLLGLLSGCGLLPEDVDETAKWSAARLYNEAKGALNEGEYQRAIELYERLEARFPYGAYAQQAQLEAAYAHYRNNEMPSAIAASERFIKLHPQHPNVDYAYYLKGLANFVEDRGLLARFSDQDMSERDPKAAREAFDAFKALVERFPDSRYTPDALARMRYLVNALAAHEVHVGRYYFRRGAYVAAANRGKFVLENYQQAPALEEALVIMARSYQRLGLKDLYDDTRRVIEKNFPDSPFITGKNVHKERPWWRFWEIQSRN